MVNFTILAGGYTTFIGTYLFNSDAGTLSLLNTYPTGNDPSWITAHPTNSSIIYAVNEQTGGLLQSFTVTPDGVLSGVIDQVASGGDAPAFCAALSTGSVAIMNYNTGNGKIIPTTTDPLHFSQDAPLITFPPPAGDVSHPHMAYEYGEEIFVPDLGSDKIWRLGDSGNDNYTIHGFVQQPTGSGPRHMAIYNDELYALHELSSTLTVQAVPPAPNGTTPFLGNVSIIPSGLPAGAAMAAGEIQIPEPTTDYPTAYIYTSNRNTGVQDPRGDAISIYERVPHPTQGLKLVGQTFTGIDQIRGMSAGSAKAGEGGESYIIAGGVAGTAGVVLYKRTSGGANLTEVARNTDLPTRTSFVWLPQ